MRRYRPLSRKLITVGAAFLLLALSSIGLTLWVTWQLEGGAAAVNEAGRLRMLTWRMASSLQTDNVEAARQAISQIEASLDLLKAGDPSRPLFVPWDENLRGQFASLNSQWQLLKPGTDRPAAPALTAGAEAFILAIDQFVSSIERQLSRWTAILNLFQMAMMALAIGSAVVLMYVGYLVVLDPLARLREGLRGVEAGDLGVRVEVAGADEFGELAEGFNRMAQTLQSLYQGLEGKVREKTASLEVERARLAALYEVSTLLARAGTLEEIAQGFASAIRRIANADAAAVRWCNDAQEQFLLVGSDCLPEALAKGEDCLMAGACLCGQPAAVTGSRVIPIIAAQAPPLDHCARAGYETLISIPVALQDRLLGEVDLFFRHPVAPSSDEQHLFDALASHLASAIEGRRANALEREAAVAHERTFLARELHDSIAQSLAFLKIQLQLLRGAIRAGDREGIDRAIGEFDLGLRESTGDVRELLVHFRTRTNAEDIEPALRSTLQKFELQSGLATHLSISGYGLPLDPDIQVQVLHVIQEALSNVRKHSAATQVWLEVQRQPEWRFEVRDDGQGFAVDEAPDETHVGLQIMRERAQRIGARVSVNSAPGTGTQVRLTLPAAATAVAAES